MGGRGADREKPTSRSAPRPPTGFLQRHKDKLIGFAASSAMWVAGLSAYHYGYASAMSTVQVMAPGSFLQGEESYNAFEENMDTYYREIDLRNGRKKDFPFCWSVQNCS